MIDDDRRDGLDGGRSNFQVIADQTAEQDYAVNIFKGSGNMDKIFEKNAPEVKKAKAAPKKKPELTNAEMAKEGESLISDTEAMYAFSSQIANQD